MAYCRNLVYVWRERRVLTPLWNAAAHAVAVSVVVVALVLTLVTWRHGYRNTTEFWVWSAIWAIGQGCFFGRFAIQWAVTDLRRKSTVPAVFWQLSLVGVVFHGSYFFHRADWMLAVGTVADAIPYIGNLWLMRMSTPDASGAPQTPPADSEQAARDR
jgi:lipid-A-disaccharide synthase-like uncharacterized protein